MQLAAVRGARPPTPLRTDLRPLRRAAQRPFSAQRQSQQLRYQTRPRRLLGSTCGGTNALPEQQPQELPELPAPPASAPPSSSASGGSSETASTSSSSGSGSGSTSDGEGGVRIDLELPRRSLLVTFTCNLCGGRTERLVNPVAWRQGMVIAQCATCQAWHKLADAANLVEEIRYADEADVGSESE